ncbi:MAG TPA: riboflavin synthase, partial [Polyangiaceae bacterium]|nr:riboflavin synthase [Polyangiaceae bacterium]
RFDDGPLELGESIAVDGACLSVDAIGSDGFEVDASGETLARTTLGQLRPGARVHLERALRVGDRLGGHFVSGHVDGLGRLVERRPLGEAVWMALRIPRELARFVAEKGSITIDGVSLTVNAVTGDLFEIVLIPHTLAKTKLGALQADDPVNVEVDLMARYAARLSSTES